MAATHGLVVYTGVLKSGGNIAVVLGPKWRFHYYAHLQDIHASSFSFVKAGSPIGTVGNTGNTAGKPSHLHYNTMSSLLPLPWRIERRKAGLEKDVLSRPDTLLNRSRITDRGLPLLYRSFCLKENL